MTAIREAHADHGATFTERGGRAVVDHYGRPERAHRAVRNVVGVTERAVGVLAVTGEDRHDFVDNALSNRVPTADGAGVYALLCDPQGRIRVACYVLSAADRLLCLTPPGHADPLAEEWREKTFIQDVEFAVPTDELAVFELCGPKATEKVASVLTGASAPEPALAFDRGAIADAGVTVVASDAPCGEDGYLVVASADDAADVFDALVNRGLNAAPFGYRTRDALTLEAGTPLFETELAGRIPNALGVHNALDFEKGCYVGQEVVSRIENRGQPSDRLVGRTLAAEAAEADLDHPALEATLPAAGAAVMAGDAAVGEVTRAAWSPMLERPIAFGFVEYDLGDESLTVLVEGESVPAERSALPFVEGSMRSARLPSYPG